MAKISVIRVNGVDYTIGGSGGSISASIHNEFRFNKNTNPNGFDLSNIEKKTRFPIGWELLPPPVEEGEYVWMITAVINSDNELAGETGEWSDPIRMSGQNGKPGPTGLPGVDVEVRYSPGTEKSYDFAWNPSMETQRIPGEWTTVFPQLTYDKPKAWFIQTRIIHKEYGDVGEIETGSKWSSPNIWVGAGEGTQGQNGQILYPAGVYDVNKEYTSDQYKTPYVYVPGTDPKEPGKQYPPAYYVLKASRWKGTENNNRTPAQQYDVDNGATWDKIENFDAVYANIGLFGSALVGGSVFNTDYLFSQHGFQYPSGVETVKYDDFDKQYMRVSNPVIFYKNPKFNPNMCINFSTGDAFFGKGGSALLSTGDGYLANKLISWTSDGQLKITGEINATSGKIGDLDIKDGGISSQTGKDEFRINPNGIRMTSDDKRVDISSSGITIAGDSGLTLDRGVITGVAVSMQSDSDLSPLGTLSTGFIVNKTNEEHTHYLHKARAGRFIFVRNISSGSIKLVGNIKDVKGHDLATQTIDDKAPRIYIYDGDSWNEWFCG